MLISSDDGRNRLQIISCCSSLFIRKTTPHNITIFAIAFDEILSRNKNVLFMFSFICTEKGSSCVFFIFPKSHSKTINFRSKNSFFVSRHSTTTTQKRLIHFEIDENDYFQQTTRRLFYCVSFCSIPAELFLSFVIFFFLSFFEASMFWKKIDIVNSSPLVLHRIRPSLVDESTSWA